MRRKRFTSTTCGIVGRKVTMAANNHDYIAEPFIVFETEDEAKAAADMVEKVSRERPMIVEASLYQGGAGEAR